VRLNAGWRFVRSAPLTYLWLAVLLVTTVLQYHLTRHELHTLLVHRSTNIAHLATDPGYVLFSSLFWIDNKDWFSCLVLFTLFLAPAEHWLGQIRWLTVGLTAHIAATYISEGLLYLAIQQHLDPEKMVHVRDVGVSYFMVGVMAVLAYHIAPPWRWGYLAAVVIYYGAGLIADLNFTAIGHVAAIVIGLCFYPIARRCDGPLVRVALT
jgi:Rhomboid-like protein